MYRIIKITIYLKLATKSRGILLSCLAVIRIQSFDLTFFFVFLVYFILIETVAILRGATPTT